MRTSTDETLSDDELTALALAADPDAPIAEEAVPIGIHLARSGFGPPALVHAPDGREVEGVAAGRRHS